MRIDWVKLFLVSTLLGALSLSAQQQAPAQSPKVTLPEGKGKELVKTECSRCHGLDNITSHRYDREGWENQMDRMITLGAQIPPEQTDVIIDYLVTYFGKKKPAATETSGTGSSTVSSTEHTILINQATAKEMQTALDLTAEEAGRLIAFRDKNGKFKNMEELEKVPGIPLKKIEAKKGDISF